MGWNKAAKNFVFALHSNWTLIWHLLMLLLQSLSALHSHCSVYRGNSHQRANFFSSPFSSSTIHQNCQITSTSINIITIMISITEITIINTSVVTIDNSEVTWKKAMTNIICAKNQEGAWSILVIIVMLIVMLWWWFLWWFWWLWCLWWLKEYVKKMW